MCVDETMKLRPATSDDLERLYEIHREALGPYVRETWGWDEKHQSAEFRRRGASASLQVVEEDGEIAGFMEVDEQSDRLLLRTIELGPEFQRRGIGTALIQGLLARSWSTGRPVHLRVLRCNPARRLYERLGFKVVRETETHVLMRTSRAG